VGHSSTIKVLVASLLVGSVALAQQGLITEPWSNLPPTAVAPVVNPHPMPASGLPPLSAAAPVTPPAPAPAPEVAAGDGPPAAKWSPPVVTLLVDPWQRTVSAPPTQRSRWLPKTQEIIDPWAKIRPAEPPRVASGPTEGPVRSTIF
jgi:hypothetical protein